MPLIARVLVALGLVVLLPLAFASGLPHPAAAPIPGCSSDPTNPDCLATPGPTAGPTDTPGPSESPHPPTPTPVPSESVDESATAGQTVTTDAENDGTTASDPVETAVTVTQDGEVLIDESTATATAPSGYRFFGQQIDISAPPGTQTDPLTITFTLDSSLLGSIPVENVQIVRDGVVLPDCTGEPFTSDDDACVVSKVPNGDGGAEFTIRTVHASEWNFAKKKRRCRIVHHHRRCRRRR